MFPGIKITVIFLFFFTANVKGQGKMPFKQEISYHIRAELDTAHQLLKGECRILYKNNSPDTLKEIWLYLRPNACQNENSIFNNRLIENGNTDLYFSDKRDIGYMTISSFQIGDTGNQQERTVYFFTEQNQFNELSKIKLASPLLPGQDVSIQITYELKLSNLYEGLATGHLDDMYIFSQWHPEVASYNEAGWSFESYIGDNESEQTSATYSAEIYLPEGYEVIGNGKTVYHNETIEWHLESSNHSKLVWGMIPSKKLKTEKVQHNKLSIQYFGQTGPNHNWINAIREYSETETTTGSESSYTILHIPTKKYLTPVFFNNFLFTFGSASKQEAKKILNIITNKAIKNKSGYTTNSIGCETNMDNNQRALWSLSKILKDYLPGKVQIIQNLDSAIENRKTKITWLYNFNNRGKYQYISISPSTFYNAYDNWMAGLLIHNIQLPKNKFQFELLPFYSINESTWRGAGGIQWTLFDNKNKGKIEIRNAFRSFGKDTYLNNKAQQKTTAYTKWQSGIRYYFPNPSNSCLQQYLEWNSSFFSETNPNYSLEPNTGNTTIRESKDRYTLHQFIYSYQNNRTLYPYNINFKTEIGKSFVRLGLEGNEFFNYRTGGGLNVRFFAGKFLYTQGKSNLTALQTERFHFNLSAPSGYEDYRYDGYFIERNAFNGYGSQQIMIRDGGFKLSTPLLSEKVGRTDNWLGTVNLTTTIPDRVNILKILPVKIPLQIFADFGTTSENWKGNADVEQILYEAGFQLSLFSNILNVYLPMIYSRSFRNYVNSMYADNKISHTIRFSIELDKLGTKKNNRY